MSKTRWLVVAAVVGLFLAAGFAFTLIGLVAEGVAVLALLALIVKGLPALAQRLSTGRHA